MYIEEKFPSLVKEDVTDYNVDNNDDNLDDQVDNNQDELSGDDELLKALESLKNPDDKDDELDDEPELNDDDLTDDEDDEDEDDSDNDDSDDNPDDQQDTGKKKVQSKEENAKFAAMRRQQEMEKKVQAELEKLKSESPEFKLAQELSQIYGKPAEQIIADMKEAQLQKEAKEKNLPLELLRERQQERDRLQSLEQELNTLKFQNWQTKIQADSQTLKQQYTMLDDADFDAAVDYILNTARNVNIPLEEAVFAIHGKKIVEGMAQQKVQDDLAKQSGRKKKTPVPPSGGKPSKAKTLTAEEQFVAKQFGMTPDDYLKYKS